jgi:hypothetical protein
MINTRHTAKDLTQHAHFLASSSVVVVAAAAVRGLLRSIKRQTGIAEAVLDTRYLFYTRYSD